MKTNFLILVLVLLSSIVAFGQTYSYKAFNEGVETPSRLRNYLENQGFKLIEEEDGVVFDYELSNEGEYPIEATVYDYSDVEANEVDLFFYEEDVHVLQEFWKQIELYTKLDNAYFCDNVGDDFIEYKSIEGVYFRKYYDDAIGNWVLEVTKGLMACEDFVKY